MDLSQTTILEVGCGTGLLSILLSNMCKKFIATDYTQELIDLAKVRNSLSILCAEEFYVKAVSSR